MAAEGPPSHEPRLRGGFQLFLREKHQRRADADQDDAEPHLPAGQFQFEVHRLAGLGVPDRADQHVDDGRQAEDERGDVDSVSGRRELRLERGADRRLRREHDADRADGAGHARQAREHQARGLHFRPRTAARQEQDERQQHADDEVGAADAQDGHQPGVRLTAELRAAVENDRHVSAPRQPRQRHEYQPQVLLGHRAISP